MTQLCACGCGEPSPEIKKTDARRGWIKGEFAKYKAGHFQRMTLTGKSASTAVQYRTGPGEIELTEQDIVNLRMVDDDDAAQVFDERVIVLEKQTKRSFIEVGMICLEMTRRDLWKRLVDPMTGSYFHSRDAWMAARLNVSRSTAYSAMEVLAARENVSLKDLREMPRVNAVRLAGLSSAVQRDPKIIEAAKGSAKGFVAVVNESYPDQHQEPRRSVMATLEDSARHEMEECFGAVRWAYDVEKREDVLANLFAFFMDGKCEREGFTNWTNREAYEAAKKRGVA